MLEFQRGLPERFHSRSTNRVISMVKDKKTKKKDEIVEMYNTELIFSRFDLVDLEDVLIMSLHPFQLPFLKKVGSPG